MVDNQLIKAKAWAGAFRHNSEALFGCFGMDPGGKEYVEQKIYDRYNKRSEFISDRELIATIRDRESIHE